MIVKHFDRKHAGIEVSGWAGMFLIIFAYMLAATGRLPATDPLALNMNIVGSAMLAFNLFFKLAWSAFTLQLVWIVISIAGLLNTLWFTP